MTPWRTHREKPQTVRVTRLQCGHGDDAVENAMVRCVPRSTKELQCGHGDDAVENQAILRRKRLRTLCFNAATAMTPWRTGGRRTARLSCGSFNAATAMTPWRTHRRSR